MDKLPTPDELGEMLATGKISRSEAVEIMAQRARLDAFSEMQQMMGASPLGGVDVRAPSSSRVGLVIVAVVGGIVALGALVVGLLSLLL